MKHTAKKWIRPHWLLTGVLLLASLPLQAADDNEPLFNVYSLSARAQGPVVNDLMTVNLTARAQADDPQDLARKINGEMGWALDQLKRHETLQIKTGNYRTWPTYARKDRQITGWEASQVVNIRSEDVNAVQQAVQKLQERLQVSDLRAVPKPETRQKAEDELIREALEQFKERATLIQQTVGAFGYRVINVSVNTGGGVPQPRPALRMAADSSGMPPPAIEAGTSELSVVIQGSVQLQ